MFVTCIRVDELVKDQESECRREGQRGSGLQVYSTRPPLPLHSYQRQNQKQLSNTPRSKMPLPTRSRTIICLKTSSLGFRLFGLRRKAQAVKGEYEMRTGTGRGKRTGKEERRARSEYDLRRRRNTNTNREVLWKVCISYVAQQ